MTLAFCNTVKKDTKAPHDETFIAECPSCSNLISRMSYDTCCDSAELSYSIDCQFCGYHECNTESCHSCKDEYWSSVFGVDSDIDAQVFLAHIEGDLLAIDARNKIGASTLADYPSVCNYLNARYEIDKCVYARNQLCSELLSSIEFLVRKLIRKLMPPLASY